MRTTNVLFGLVPLGLAFTFSAAAVADPGERDGLRGRGSGAQQLNRNYYLYKKYYRNDQERDRTAESGKKTPDNYGAPENTSPVLYRKRNGEKDI